MSSNNTNDDDDRMNRRTVLKASGVSVLGSAAIGDVAASTNQKYERDLPNEPEDHPDLKVIDNSNSDVPVSIDFRPAKSSVQTAADENELPIAELELQTTGINYEPEDPKTMETPPLDDAFATIDQLSIDQPGALTEGSADVYEMAVSYQGSSDVTEILVGPDGAPRPETVVVHISPDGTVTASTKVTCK